MWSAGIIIETLETVKNYLYEEEKTERELFKYIAYHAESIEPLIPHFFKNIEKMWYSDLDDDQFKNKASKYIDSAISFIRAKSELDRIAENIKDGDFLLI